MESSRRAVESYWRSRMIDAATSDEDKVAPVYKLEEICELLRSSHVSIVKEVSEFIFRRLEHKSPIVKQKALRVIKYAVGKSGVEFRREMQRNSVVVRQLIHYKGQSDPLKGDALNKSVRETAQEALTAIFSGEDNNKPPPKEGLTQRIQGFGNKNSDTFSDDKKSFFNEVVGIGSATIKYGLNSVTQSQTQSQHDSGSYKSLNLRRSLTNESSYSDINRLSTNGSGSWGQESQTDNGNASSSYSHDKSREERLLETVVTSGGVRLQPTRDAIHAFLMEAVKLNKLDLSRALEGKLQSHMWQVRVKAMCVLEALLRKKDDEQFSIVTSYFIENIDVVVKCSESPQASLREKANKVLTLLDEEQNNTMMSRPNTNFNPEKTVIQIPDLIDTNDPYENDNLIQTQTDQTTSLIHDLFTDNGSSTHVQTEEHKNIDDPFADVAFHGQDSKDELEATDIFSGMATQTPVEFFDIFGSKSEIPQGIGKYKNDVNELMTGLSINGNESNVGPTEMIFSDAKTNSTYNGLSSGLMFNPTTFNSQPINYGVMNNIIAQQQFLSSMSNLQSWNSGASNAYGTSAFPDIFNPNVPNQTTSSMMNTSKKDDTRAFDFISDHLAAARDPRRVT